MKNKNNLGCGKGFKIIGDKEIISNKNPDFICGVADAWGSERLCLSCRLKLKKKWKEEDILRELKGGNKK